MAVLLICPDTTELALLAQALEQTGLHATLAQQVEDALVLRCVHTVDMIILVDYDGDFLLDIRWLRAMTVAPIILLEDPLREDEHIAALHAGADLVFLRPYSMRLIAIQISTFLRRVTGLSASLSSKIENGDIRLDSTSRTVKVLDQPPCRLSRLEFRLFYKLMLNPKQVLSHSALVEHIWGYTGEGDIPLLRKLVYRLRAKIEPDRKNPQYIITVPYVGYTFGGSVQDL